MRFALLALCLGLGGCIIDTTTNDDGYYPDYGGGGGWGSGWGGSGGNAGFGCESDSACGSGLTCTRTGECLTSSLVRVVRTIWTIDGATASDAACSAAPKLSITFATGSGEQFGYTPVPCNAGKFTIDKFPARFTMVQLAREEDYSGGGFGTFNTDGTATLDLPY